MPHMVIFRSAEGKPGYHQAEGLEDAVRFVEHLRNQENVNDTRIFRMQEVPIEFKAYYRVEVAASPSAGESAEAPAPTSVSPEAEPVASAVAAEAEPAAAHAEPAAAHAEQVPLRAEPLVPRAESARGEVRMADEPIVVESMPTANGAANRFGRFNRS